LKLCSTWEIYERHEEERHIPRNEQENKEEEYTFPIRESGEEAKMKNINPSNLPLFYGLPIEDPDTFLFEFEVLCHTYEYKNNAQKLRLVSLNFEGCFFKMVYGTARRKYWYLGRNE
jgi:hypothetical protein